MGLIVVLAFVALDVGVIVVVFVVVVFVSAPMATIVIAAHATAIIGIIFVIDLKKINRIQILPVPCLCVYFVINLYNVMDLFGWIKGW